mgnify:CR=1 FL=1
MKILLVDDERTEREGIRFLMDKFHFELEVAEASNGKLAMEYMQKHADVDILLTDVKMPYMDGLELSRYAKEKRPDVIIIIFSAYSEFDYAKKACEVNAVNYLLKPIEVDEFKQVMEHVISLCEQKKQWREQKENLLVADKKLLLYRLFNSKDAVTEIIEKLKEYQINLENKYICFVSIETRNNYFELYEESFEMLLKRNMKLKYEQIDFYPNQIYLMIYSSEPIEERSVENSIRLVYASLLEEKAEMPSIIVGTGFFGMKDFNSRVKEMEEVRKDTFSYFSGVIYTAQKAARDTGTLEETMQMKDSIFRSIEDENMPAVEEQMLVYLKRLEHEKSSSAFYAKYLILDIVKAIYQKYGIYNQGMIMQTADDIMNSNDLQKVGEVVSKVIHEITVSQKQSLPDTSLTVSEIKKVIKNEYMKDIGLEEIAERVCLTASYVSFVFKKETGYNLVKYLTDYRMKKAKELLEESNWKIVDIGKACGYTNQPYFNKLFKNYYGVTPKQYREQK